MEALILSHLAMMLAIGSVFALLQVIDRDWRLPWQWTVMFFVLPVGMVTSGLGERQDDDGLRLIGLLGAYVGPILLFDGIGRFTRAPRPAVGMLAGFLVYAPLAAATVYLVPDLGRRVMLVILYHMALALWLVAIARRLDPGDHALSRRILQVVGLSGLPILTVALVAVARGAATEPGDDGPGMVIIGLANAIGAMLALTCLVMVAERMSGFIRREARTDPLTGLHTRRSFDLALAQEIGRSRRYGRPLGLILFDVDRFKTVNDTHGHDVGDIVLQRVGTAARAALRPADLMARLGGDEFAVLLPEADRAEALHVAWRVRDAVRALAIEVPGVTLTISGSFGVAALEPPPDAAADLLKRADIALYAVKRAGRDGVSDGMEAPALSA